MEYSEHNYKFGDDVKYALARIFTELSEGFLLGTPINHGPCEPDTPPPRYSCFPGFV